MYEWPSSRIFLNFVYVKFLRSPKVIVNCFPIVQGQSKIDYTEYFFDQLCIFLNHFYCWKST